MPVGHILFMSNNRIDCLFPTIWTTGMNRKNEKGQRIVFFTVRNTGMDDYIQIFKDRILDCGIGNQLNAT
jgi:hypothetical protein